MSYNPYEVLESRYSRAGYGQQKKSNEPIMYDPMKARSANRGPGQKEKNVALPGSLLKVWEGVFELAKDNQINA